MTDDTVTATLDSGESCIDEQNVSFIDAEPNYKATVDSSPDKTFGQASTVSTDLAQFLSRPVKIANIEILVGGTTNTSYDVWELFYSNPAVQNKISNYHLLRSKLMVKMVVNASPFLYGKILASYNPLTMVDDTYPSVNPLWQRSQRPHVVLDVGSNSGGCLCLPFASMKNALRTDVIADFTDMGTVNLDSFTDIQSANGGTGSITISMYAWATDVDLSVPTIASPFTPQAGEFNSDQLISKPATAIATAAGFLTAVPVIGPFATATSIAAGAVASIARIFGYSRVKQLVAPVFVRNQPINNLASTDVGETVHTLAVDSKNEFSVDSRTVGLNGVDEMSLKFLCEKESYITQFPWTPLEAPDKIIWWSTVAPMLSNVETVPVTLEQLYVPTAMNFATLPFGAWTGTIKFRFQIVCSKFHRGRLRFLFDPAHYEAVLTTQPESSNILFTKIVDIADEKDFTMTVAWAQDTAYLSTDWDYDQEHFGSGVLVGDIDEGYANGYIGCQIINSLTGPTDAGSVQILVSVSAGEDFQLRNPTSNRIDNLTYFKPESGEISDYTYNRIFGIREYDQVFYPQAGVCDVVEDGENNPVASTNVYDLVMSRSSVDPMVDVVYYGESIDSFRTMMKRYAFSIAYLKTTAASTRQLARYRNRNFPRYFGDTANSDITIGGVTQNPTGATLLNYLTPAYAGWRGGIRWKFLLGCKSTDVVNQYVQRSNRSAEGYTNVDISTADTFIGHASANYAKYLKEGITGMTATHNDTNGGLEVEIPFQSKYRMALGRNLNQYEGSTVDDSDLMGHDYIFETDYAGSGTDIHGCIAFVAAGDDFSLFFFINAPAYFTAVRPTPP